MAFRPSPLLDSARPAAPHGAMPERAQRVAALLLRVPFASVCAVGSRAGGLPSRDGAMATPSCAASPAAALYAEVLARRAPLVIADAATVVAPPLAEALRAQAWRSFVGVPLLMASGAVRGVLAVADVVPRAWRADDLALLADLAALAAEADAAVADEGLRWVRETAQREAHEARRKSERWLALVFNSTADITFLVAVEGERRFRCVAVNDAYLAVTGLAEAAIVGRLLDEVLPPEAAARTAERYAEAARAGEPRHFTECVELPVGVAYLETLLTPILDETGRCSYLLGVGRDVSARRRAEAELRTALVSANRARSDAEAARVEAEAARRAAELASEAKADFVSRMSHELRTPLNSVIGFANMLRANRRGELDPRDLSYLDRIVTNGRHLLGLVSDLLDIARIEAGRMPLAPCPVPLGPLVRTTLALFEPHVADGAVELRADVPDALERLDTDPTRLQQVLVNLVANAVRCTPRGHVTVRVIACERTRRPLRIEVEDTGVGIAGERLEAIFEAFEQGASAVTVPQGGSGLGLAISRSLCGLMGFAIRVHSRPGEGSTFTVELAPATAIDTPADAPSGAAAADARRTGGGTGGGPDDGPVADTTGELALAGM